MNQFNSLFIDGIAVQDPLLRTLASKGNRLCTLTISSNRHLKIKVEAYSPLAEYMYKNISKGRAVRLTGSLTQQHWKDRKKRLQVKTFLLVENVKKYTSTQNLNFMVLEGNLTRDPDFGVSRNGVFFSKFSVSPSRSFNAGAPLIQNIGSFNVEIWSEKALHFYSSGAVKGRGVRVVGNLEQRIPPGREGSSYTGYTITAQHVELTQEHNGRSRACFTDENEIIHPQEFQNPRNHRDDPGFINTDGPVKDFIRTIMPATS
jgi:single-stranded DNA-binding protein